MHVQEIFEGVYRLHTTHQNSIDGHTQGVALVIALIIEQMHSSRTVMWGWNRRKLP